MKNMVRQLIAVTFGLCLSMFFSICSFASTGYPWFQVPNNAELYYARLTYYLSDGTSQSITALPDSNNVISFYKPSDFVTQSSTYAPRIRFYFRNQLSGYYGITIGNSNVAFIDTDPQINIGNICWSNKGYYQNQNIYSMQSTYISNPSSRVSMGQVTIFHPSGVDGGSSITASDFPVTFRVNCYTGQFNYAGITSDASYNATEINSNKANTAIDLSYANSENLDSLELRVDNNENSILDIRTTLDDNLSILNDYVSWIVRLFSLTSNQYADGSTWTAPNGTVFSYPRYNRHTFTIVNEKVQITDTVYCGTALGIINRRFEELFLYFQKLFDVVWEWWYPLKSTTPQYWNVYNTDTDDTELVNPSTVTYYITWYLGQLFLMNNDDTPLGDLQDHVDDIKDQFQTVESQESSIIDSIDDSFSSFMPDLSQIGSFRALSWCSNYLQQIYVSLGAYGTVILIGLLLGVCMQFIGYFRYK